VAIRQGTAYGALGNAQSPGYIYDGEAVIFHPAYKVKAFKGFGAYNDSIAGDFIKRTQVKAQ
jgi:hypothetical protein